MTYNIKKNYAVIGICFIVSFVTLLLFAISISPLTLFEGEDSCVFKQMGLAILQGKTPYVDLFDHKGPIIYFVNALGLWIGGRWGLFVFCVLNFTFVLYYWWKIACLYVSDIVSVFAILFTIAMYISVLDDGNMTEEWSLLPLSYSLYLSLRLQKEKHGPSEMESCVIGISAGIILFIRANNVALLLCAFVLIAYLLLSSKSYRPFIKFLFYTFVGMFSVVSIILLFFYLQYGQNGMEQMLYGTFVFNMTAYNPYRLASNSLKEFIMSNVIFFFFPIEIYKLFFLFGIVLCFYAYINNKGNKENKIVISFLVGSFSFCFYILGRDSYGHYLITTLPLFVVAISYTLKNSICNYILCIFFPLYFSVLHMYSQISYILFGYKKVYSEFYHKADLFIDSVDSIDRTKIWNYNAVFQGIDLLQRYNITQCNRIIHPFQLNSSEYLRKTDRNKLKSVKPKYILLDPTNIYYCVEDSLYISWNYIKSDSITKRLLILKYHDRNHQ